MFVKSILNTDADRRRTVQGFPVGAITLWHGTSAPSGWVVCDGSQLPISSYQSLYNTITATATVFPFGANTNGSSGAGSTHFRLPDMRDRYVMSPTATANNPGTGFVGTTGGNSSHSHNATPLVNANVDSSSHSHSYSMGSLTNAGSHTHSGGPIGTNTSSPAPTQNRAQTGNTAISVQSHSHNLNFGSNEDGAHSHTVSGPTNTTSNAHLHSTISTSANATTTNSASHLPSAMRASYIIYTGTT